MCLASRVRMEYGGTLSAEQQRQLALLQHVLPRAVAQTTYTQYQNEWDKYEAACARRPTPAQPLGASEIDIALYLAAIFGECAVAEVGCGRMRKVSASIAFFFHQAGMPSPTEAPLCSQMVKGASRLLFAKHTAREPLMPEQLKRVLEHHLGDACNIGTRMHLTVLLLMFTGLLRYSDVAQVVVHQDLLRIVHDESGTVQGALMFVLHSKTDQKCIGHWVAVGATHGPLCPVALLQTLLRQGRYVCDPAEGQDCGPLLRAVYRGRNNEVRLKQYTAPFAAPIRALGYSTFMGHLQALIKEAGVEGHFGTHSARIGGTTAATMGGANDTRILGRWKFGDTMNDVYAKEIQQNAQRFFELTKEFWPF